MQTVEFSSALLLNLTIALNGYVAAPGDLATARLRAVTERVCTEAHALGMTPEAMVIALRRFYEAIPVGEQGMLDRRRAAYDRLLSGCIHAYFAAKPQD